MPLVFIKTRLKLNSMPTSLFELEGYIIEHTPNESSCGGALLYIDHYINYKVHNNLKMYKAKELEPIFIEILNRNSKNTILDPSINILAWILQSLMMYTSMMG